MTQDLTETFDADVIIVGYGPVGQFLALLLSRRGLRVIAVERYAQPYQFPRAIHFDHEIARLFQSAGIGEAVSAICAPVEEDVLQYVDADRNLLMQMPLPTMGPSGWPFANNFAQPDLERVISEAADCAGVIVMRGWDAQSIAQVGEAAEVAIARTGSLADHRVLRAKYSVGTDGANSLVRRHLDVCVTDCGFDVDWLVVNLLYTDPHAARPGMMQVCDPARPVTVVPGGPGRARFEFMLQPGETEQEMNDPAIAWRLVARFGVTPDTAVLERHAVYRFGARWAEDWRVGRLFLAGDAAHVMPPFRAQGMCSGMRDAAALAWRLGMVLRMEADPAILDSYAPERIGHVSGMIRQAIEIGRIICTTDPAMAAARNAGMRAAQENPAMPPPPPPPPDRLGQGITEAGNAQAGLLSFQGVVELNGRVGLFDDVVGKGFVLVGVGLDPAKSLSDLNLSYLRALGCVVAHVASDGPVRDVTGAYTAWFARNGICASLYRPDLYQVGGAARPDDIDALVSALRIGLPLLLAPAAAAKQHAA